MKKAGTELNLRDAGHEAKYEIDRLCERVRAWAYAMACRGTGQFEVHWIASTAPGAAPTGPEAAEVLQSLIWNYYEIEGFAVLVRRSARDRSRIQGTPGEVTQIKPDLLKMISTSGRDSGLEPGDPSLIDELMRKWLEVLNERLE